MSTATMEKRFTSQRHAMLSGFSTLGKSGGTAEQAAMAADVSPYSCFWKRASELRSRGLLEPVMKKGEQEFRESRAGGFQSVWKISPAGRQQLKDWNRA